MAVKGTLAFIKVSRPSLRIMGVSKESTELLMTPGSRVRWGTMGSNISQLNIRQANGVGRVHVAKPQMKVTYCGRPVNEEDWLITSKEANCSACTRAGAPRPEWPGSSNH